jgi:hypothetical protein
MRPLALLVLLALAAPAAAQPTLESLGLPQGCTARLSVLDAGCFWTHEVTCEGDPAGSIRHVMPTGEGVVMTLLDADGQLLESFDSFDGVTWRLARADQPTSFQALFADGHHAYDFTVEPDDGSPPLRLRGEDRLTGETATLDGQDVQVTDFSYEVIDETGATLWSASGQQYVTEDPPAVFSGFETYSDGTSRDMTPTDVVRPGEPGFLSAFAPEACLASLPAPAVEAKPQPAK